VTRLHSQSTTCNPNESLHFINASHLRWSCFWCCFVLFLMSVSTVWWQCLFLIYLLFHLSQFCVFRAFCLYLTVFYDFIMHGWKIHIKRLNRIVPNEDNDSVVINWSNSVLKSQTTQSINLFSIPTCPVAKPEDRLGLDLPLIVALCIPYMQGTRTSNRSPLRAWLWGNEINRRGESLQWLVHCHRFIHLRNSLLTQADRRADSNKRGRQSLFQPHIQ